MWECIKCRQFIPTEDVEPGIDDFGIYFICPVCERRNKLVSLGPAPDDGAIQLMQTGE